ncbi:Hypothetical protein SRAE_1000324900 [Strongyloides ratti]|uniref:F-box domain-containing protein n=1 Tax=Strongyloides ratti TaxID=34506 RepID=A0A090L5B6_STRRB|nr:Hypothetical protein SRAE_1000324900 [Strongyloides ratti]CEF64996.1 Hypothetical protein SRAE_1000324900 [Strongyloides ratti]
METIEMITFIDLMEISLIRKKILQKLSTFCDISNLAKTSKYMDYLIYHEKIRRDMFRYFDEQYILIKTKGNPEIKDIQNLHNINYLKDEEFCKELETVQNFNGETITFKNEITFEIVNTLENINANLIDMFIKRLIIEANINCSFRKHVTSIEFKIEDISFSQNNHNLVLHTISYMNHQNIKRIKIPDIVFMSDVQKYDNLKTEIFGGFPKFNELIITVVHIQAGFIRLIKNKCILEKILKELSRRKNATLTLECYSDEYNIFINLAYMIQKMATKYQIKVKCDIGHIIPLLKRRRDLICSTERCVLYPIENIVTSFFNYISGFSMFMVVIKNLQHFINVEKIEIRISLLNIREEMKKKNLSDLSILSLKQCNKLRKIKIEFLENFNDIEDCNNEILYDDLQFIVSILPKCIERVELWNIPNLTKDVMKRLNECLPNIKILVTWEVTFKDFDCLSILKNLKAFVSYQNFFIHIPDTIKLLAIGSNNCLEADDTKKLLSQQLIKKYSERFSKRVQSSRGRFIFFNDIKQWKKYKRLFQDNFYFFC